MIRLQKSGYQNPKNSIYKDKKYCLIKFNKNNGKYFIKYLQEQKIV